MSQRSLPNIRAPHVRGTQGRDLESLVEAANHYYAVRGAAFVRRNPRQWEYTGERALKMHPALWARTGNGRILMQGKADVDFGGVLAGGRMVAFDAKEHRGASVPLKQFTPHQVERLCQLERAGAAAFFLVYLTDKERVFRVSPSKVRDAQDRAQFGRGPKSLSLAWLEENAVEVEAPRGGRLLEYLSPPVEG